MVKFVGLILGKVKITYEENAIPVTISSYVDKSIKNIRLILGFGLTLLYI